VAVQFAAGKAALHVNNLHLLDYHTIPNALALGPNDPAVVSFDVVWSGPIMRRVSVLDGTLGNNYAGEYVENQVTVTWSGTNLTTGFTFTSNPGTLATSVVDGGFAELGHERNGSFHPSGAALVPPGSAPVGPLAQDPGDGAAPTDSAPDAGSQGFALVLPARDDGNPTLVLQQTPLASAGATHSSVADLVFADIGGSPLDNALWNDLAMRTG
jgi:hypothetical protein